jgi:hypothetical protein
MGLDDLATCENKRKMALPQMIGIMLYKYLAVKCFSLHLDGTGEDCASPRRLDQ